MCSLIQLRVVIVTIVRLMTDGPISGLLGGQACSELDHHLDGLLSRYALGLMLMTACEWQSSSMLLHILLHASLI